MQRFGGFDAEGVAAVHYARALLLQVRQVAERVENRVGVAASPRRWAHAIENQAELLMAVGRDVEMMVGGVEADVGDGAAIQFRENREKPARVLVVDGDGLCWRRGWLARF